MNLTRRDGSAETPATMGEAADDGAPARDAPGRLREVAGLFLRLGFTAFGGPAAHVALMEDEVVTRRGWVDRQRFLDLVALVNFIPGPNSTELAIHLGLLRAGFRGLVVAGVCFIVPAVLIILPMAWAYERFGALPRVAEALAGINAGVIAVLAVACWRFAKTSLKDPFTTAVAVLVTVAMFFARRRHVPQAEPIALAAAACAGAARQWLAWRRTLVVAPPPLAGLAFLPTGAVLVGAATSPHWLLSLVLFFLKVGGTLFGSGYVLVSYLQAGLVEQRGWLTERQLLDSVAVGQVTPGPLLTTATFVGYVVGYRHTGSAAAGVLGGVAATAAIFLPAFVFVALLGKWLPRLREAPAARGALDAANAAVAALVLVVTVTLATQALRGPFTVAVALAAAALLLTRVNATWVMLAAAAAGLAMAWWHV
jgi:chromate transporter